MAKATHVRVSGSWKEVNNVWQRVSGVWKEEVMPHVRVSGVWKECMEYGPISLIKYGKLYTWAAATGGTLITGMTIGTDAQWTTLTNYIHSTYNGSPNDFGVGNHLKHPRKNGTPVLSSEYNTSTHPRWNADATHYGRDTVKFGAFPGGSRGSNGTFYDFGGYGLWWSSTGYGATGAWRRYMSNNWGVVSRGSSHKSTGLSARCFRAATSGEQSNYSDGDVIAQVTDYDGNVYDCIRIGTQVWTKQNIATTKYTNGGAVNSYNPDNDSSNVFFANEAASIW